MDDVIGVTAEATNARNGIPLELAPLLSSYRRHGRLSLRVERLPDRARLSRGSNNGDRTWSLTVDDLDGLTYLPPAGMDQAHTLAIRIVSLQGDYGATLAVLDLPVSPGAALAASAPNAAASSDGAADREGEAELRRLRGELEETKALLAGREGELAETRQELARLRAKASGPAIETEMAAARTAWEVELRERLTEAAAAAAAALETSRAAWQAEQEDRFAEWGARAEEQIEQARERGQQEAKAALLKEEAAWKADDAARFAAAEARWQEESDRALAEAKARLERAEAALVEARAHAAATLEQSRAAWQSEQAQRLAEAERRAQEGIEEARARGQEEGRAALSKAENAWKSGEAVRLAAASAQWRDESLRALAEAAARFERAEAALAEARAEAETEDVERRRLRDELAAAKASLAASEAALTDRKLKLDQLQREGSRQTIEAEPAAARVALEAEFKTRLAEAAAEAATALEQSRAAWRSEQEQRLVEAERRAQEDIEEARERWQEEAKAALSKTEDMWKADEAVRLAAASAQGRDDSMRALAEAQARLERAEAALTEAHAQAEGDAVELHFLREELAEVKASLADREAELAAARSATEEVRRYGRTAAKIAPEVAHLQVAERLLAGRTREDANDVRVADVSGAPPRRRDRPRIGRRLVQAGALLSAVAMTVMFYPRIEQTVFENWPELLPSAAETEPSPHDLEAPGPRRSSEAARVAEERTVIGAPVVHVRAGPSTASAVITTLTRDTEVTPVERRGKWVHIRIGGGSDGAHEQEGWVYGSALKLAAGP